MGVASSEVGSRLVLGWVLLSGTATGTDVGVGELWIESGGTAGVEDTIVLDEIREDCSVPLFCKLAIEGYIAAETVSDGELVEVSNQHVRVPCSVKRLVHSGGSEIEVGRLLPSQPGDRHGGVHPDCVAELKAPVVVTAGNVTDVSRLATVSNGIVSPTMVDEAVLVGSELCAETSVTVVSGVADNSCGSVHQGRNVPVS